eukprot:2311154-Amphidinium_carterae.1
MQWKLPDSIPHAGFHAQTLATKTSTLVMCSVTPNIYQCFPQASPACHTLPYCVVAHTLWSQCHFKCLSGSKNLLMHSSIRLPLDVRGGSMGIGERQSILSTGSAYLHALPLEQAMHIWMTSLPEVSIFPAVA